MSAGRPLKLAVNHPEHLAPSFRRRFVLGEVRLVLTPGDRPFEAQGKRVRHPALHGGAGCLDFVVLGEYTLVSL